ncbi:hypothetical protein SISNIDRAFT_57650 [Sistotremastrum niveocremeum HHB9708]|uniref:Uncharacterized protein n=2 Tax=Sistotremastraceae TaxID=3402574 RepID=A0A164VEE3_9AGAM|nr:hypothetical protein SISNIDRAFT_57650 [Sistotremastrum niveocremeum HHB9708]KZT32029.1 hypothetical protein SISSUDRAFT_593133 [Sistotremastrum suecicum HHB10207 ss-3]
MSSTSGPIIRAEDECQVTELTPGQRIGLTISVEAALLSLFAVLLVLGSIGVVVCRRRWRHRKGFRLVTGPLDVYVLSLICSDMMQAIGGILNIRWINEGVVKCSSYCDAQGIIQNMGETGSAMATIAIALNTFVVIFFRKQPVKLWAAVLIASSIWGFCVFFPVIGFLVFRHSSSPFLAPTPFWCWIGSHYAGDRIGGEYLWLWIAALESFVLYVPLFFILLQGTEAGGRKWWQLMFLSNTDSEDEVDDVRAASFKMLLFPFTYSVLVVPLSVCRWVLFRHPHAVPSQATFAVYSLFSLMGLVDVLLLINMRRDLYVIG